ncbi:MAG: 3'-5' exonuclease [Bacteroidota bacterium]
MNFIIFDLEATCWADKRLNYAQEIIEIGALLVNRYGEVESTFNSFVKPIVHPYLSPFCIELTSIRQVDVERAPYFPEVIDDFQDWIGLFDDEEYLLASWGSFDKKMLIQDCKLHELEHDWVDHHINLKRQYQEIKRLRRPRGLQKAVKHEGFEFTGTAHRGIDDAENLAKVFAKYLDEWRF